MLSGHKMTTASTDHKGAETAVSKELIRAEGKDELVLDSYGELEMTDELVMDRYSR